jgi:hypothetical protein
MCILWVLLDDSAEVFDSLVVVFNHLVCLRSLMHIPNIVGDAIDASAEGPNRFFELLSTTVRQANMVVDISLIGHERLVLKRFLK